MGKVIDLPVITRLDLNPDRVLNASIGKMESVIVIGWDANDELYFGSSLANGGDVLWLIEKAKLALLTVGEE